MVKFTIGITILVVFILFASSANAVNRIRFRTLVSAPQELGGGALINQGMTFNTNQVPAEVYTRATTELTRLGLALPDVTQVTTATYSAHIQGTSACQNTWLARVGNPAGFYIMFKNYNVNTDTFEWDVLLVGVTVASNGN